MRYSVPLTIIVKIALEQTVAGQSIAFLLSDLSKKLTPLRTLSEAMLTHLSGLPARRRPLIPGGRFAPPLGAERGAAELPEAMRRICPATGPQTP